MIESIKVLNEKQQGTTRREEGQLEGGKRARREKKARKRNKEIKNNIEDRRVIETRQELRRTEQSMEEKLIDRRKKLKKTWKREKGKKK